MIPLAEGVWHDTGPVRIVGMKLTSTMTVLDVGGGALLVHSPLPLTPRRRDLRVDRFHDREREPFTDSVVEIPGPRGRASLGRRAPRPFVRPSGRRPRRARHDRRPRRPRARDVLVAHVASRDDVARAPACAVRQAMRL